MRTLFYISRLIGSIFALIKIMNPILRAVIPYLSFPLLILASFRGQAQPNSAYPIKVAQDRMLWHDKVDKQQQILFQYGGNKNDTLMRLTRDETVNVEITDALSRQVDEM